MSELPTEKDLHSFDDSPLKPIENRQHRLLWTEKQHTMYNRRAWFIWLKIGAMIAGLGASIIAFWTFITHGAK